MSLYLADLPSTQWWQADIPDLVAQAARILPDQAPLQTFVGPAMEESSRDLAALVVPLAGRVVATGDAWEPWRLTVGGRLMPPGPRARPSVRKDTK